MNGSIQFQIDVDYRQFYTLHYIDFQTGKGKQL